MKVFKNKILLDATGSLFLNNFAFKAGFTAFNSCHCYSIVITNEADEVQEALTLRSGSKIGL